MMLRRLRIELSSPSGDATGFRLEHDLLIDVSRHDIAIDQNGTACITIMGTVGRTIPATIHIDDPGPIGTVTP